MKKTIIMAVLASAALASCDQKELMSENVESESLKIMTSINMIESRAGFVAKTDFATNDMINRMGRRISPILFSKQ